MTRPGRFVVEPRTSARGAHRPPGRLGASVGHRSGSGRMGATLLVTLVAAVVVLLLLPRPAHAQKRAKLIDLYGSVLVGGMTGDGSSDRTSDFFHDSQGLATGVNLGIRLLVLDLSVRYLQTFDSNGSAQTLSTILFGPSIEVPVVGGGLDVMGRPRPIRVVVRPGLAGGLGFGTSGPVSPPLDSAQLSAKGLLILGRCAVERLFGPYLGLGGELQAGYHYMLAGSGTVNGPHSQGWQLAMFATASAHFGI